MAGFFDAALLKYRQIVTGAGVPLPQRGRIRFTGGTPVDNPTNDSTDIPVGGGGAGQTFTLASSSVALNPGDVVAPLPSDPTQVTKGTVAAVLAAHAIAGVVDAAYSPGATGVVVRGPGETVPASVFGDLGAGAASLLQLTASGRSRRKLVWSGGEIRVGAIAANGVVTIDPFVPAVTAPYYSYSPITYGAAGDDITDDLDAFNALIVQIKSDAVARGDNVSAGGRIDLGTGSYYLRDTWAVDTQVEFVGRGGGANQNIVSALRSAPGRKVLKTYELNSPNANPGTADGSRLSRFAVRSSAMAPASSGMGISRTRTAGALSAGECVVPTPNTNKLFFRWSGGTVPGTGDLAGFATAVPGGTVSDGAGTWTCEAMPLPRLDSHAYRVGDRYLNMGANAVLVDSTSHNVVTASNTTPITITTDVPHKRRSNDLVMITGVSGNSAANGRFTISVTGANTFTLQNANTGVNVAGTGAGTGGTAVIGDECNVFYYECTVAGTSGDSTHRPSILAFGDISVQYEGNTFSDGTATFKMMSASLIVVSSTVTVEHVTGWDTTGYVVYGEGNAFQHGGCDSSEFHDIYTPIGAGGCLALVGQDANGIYINQIKAIDAALFTHDSLDGSTRNHGGNTVFDATQSGLVAGVTYGQVSKGRSILCFGNAASCYFGEFSETVMNSRFGTNAKVIVGAGNIEGNACSINSLGHSVGLKGYDETRDDIIVTTLGQGDGVTALSVLATPTETSAFSGWAWSNAMGTWPAGWWVWTNSGQPANASFGVPGPAAKWPDGTSFAMYGLWTPTRLFFGATGANPPSVDFGAAKPSSGKFAFGSVRFNQNRFGGTNAGWVNTAAGSPGTWVEFGSYGEQLVPSGGRLSLTTAVPVTTADVTGASTLYWTPYKTGRITLYNAGTGLWETIVSAEVTLTLSSLTSGKNYDVFAYNNAGTLTLELSLAWSTDTARNQVLALQDGVLVKSADHSRLWLGTIRTTGTTTTEDSVAKRFVFNAYNREPRKLKVIEATASWAYTSAAYQAANASAANAFEYLAGDASLILKAKVRGLVSTTNTASVAVAAGVGIDSTTVQSADLYGGDAPADISSTLLGPVPAIAEYEGAPGLGYHKITWLEYGGASVTFYGQGTAYQTGMLGEVLA